MEFRIDSPRPPKKFHPHPFSYHQEVDLEITSLTNMGQGLGRAGGWVVFVPFAIPGELVRCRIYRNDKNFSEADLVEVLRPSASRVTPKCALFGRCGGCQYQHMDYPLQLDWKRRQVEELLRHMAGIDHPVLPVIPSPQTYGYRSKITPHFEVPRDGKMGEIGFLRTGRGRSLVDVPHCEIATPAINEALTSQRELVHRQVLQYKKGATLLLRDASGTIHTNARETAHETVCGVQFTFLAGDFFQNNPFILESFVTHGMLQAAADGAKYLVDAYCGSGLFALCGAGKFQHVLGVEVSESAVRQAEANAAANGLTNCKFLAGKAEAIFAAVEFPPDDTAVLIDPPRAGCDPQFLAQLFAYGPRTVVYVSCNPATQMRDLREFIAAGWHIQKVQPFDLFPQTKHLECVVTLTRGSEVRGLI